jgi:hypothetical protein
VARGKYRSDRFQDDYHLSDRDLSGAYIDEMRLGSPVRFAAEPDGDDDGDGDGESPATADVPEDPTPAATQLAFGGKPTFRQRLAAAIAPKPPGPRPARSPSRAPTPSRGTARPSGGAATRPARSQVVVPEGKTLQDLINNLEHRERLVALVTAALGLAYAIFLAIYFAHPQPHVKDPVDGPVVASIIGGPSLLFGASVFIGRRALVGFLALLTGFAMLTVAGPYGIIYFGVGLWLIMKAQKYSRAAREEAGDVRPARRSRQDGAPAKGAAARKSGGKGRPASAGPKAPAASKRYTPPRGATASGRRRATTS